MCGNGAPALSEASEHGLLRLIKTFRTGSLRANLVWTVGGSVAQLGSQWATLMLLAKLGSPERVGEFSFALGLCAPVTVTAMLGLRTILVTDARREWAYADYLALRVLVIPLGMVAVLGFALAATRDPARLAVIMALAAWRFGDVQADIHYAQLQRHERMDLVAISMGLRGASTLLGMILGLAVARSLLVAALATVALSTLVWWRFDLPAVRRVSGADESVAPRFDRARLAGLLAKAAPLAGSALITSLASPLPRYFLEAYHGQRAVGFFAVASSPLALVGFLPGAIYQSTAARAAVYFQGRETRAFLRLAAWVTAANVAISGGFYLGSLALGGLFLERFFTAEYRSAWPELNLFCLSAFLQSFAALGSQVLNAGRMFTTQMINAVFSVCVLAAASQLLVPRFGVHGSAWADVVYKVVSATFVTVVGVWQLRAHTRRG